MKPQISYCDSSDFTTHFNFSSILAFLFCCFIGLPCAQAAENGKDAENDTVVDSEAPAGEQDRYEDLRLRVEALEKKDAARDAADFRTFWKNGVYVQSADESITVKFSGSIHVDTFFLSGDRKLDQYLATHGDTMDDGMAFRRARIGLSGTLHSDFIYKAVYDFTGGSPQFKDVYVGMQNLPGNTVLKVGHFREPFSFQSVTSASGLMFLERSQLQYLTPSRNTGIGLFGSVCDGRATWAAAAFYNTDNYGDGGGDGDISATARVTCLPWYEGDDKLFHAGMAYSRRGEDDLQYEAGFEIADGPDILDTDGFASQSPHLIRVDEANLYGYESAFVYGPFSTHAEYVRVAIDQRRDHSVDFWSAYMQAGFFLTGEHRSYRKAVGVPGSIKPAADFNTATGDWGAFELTARCSFLDLDDRHIANGGEVISYTTGLNWYLNPSVYVSTNYIINRMEKIGGARILILRMALGF